MNTNSQQDTNATPTEFPLTVKLKHPIDFAGETISSLTFQRGRMRDLRGMKLDATLSIDQIMLIASRMCGQPTVALDLLDAEDGAEVLAIAADFFARSLRGPSTL